MTWAAAAIRDLQCGWSTEVRPRGHSMEPRIRSGAKVRLEPNKRPRELEKGDIVLVKVRGRIYLHQITAADAKRVQIGNNRGGINGWVPRERPYGKAVLIVNSPTERSKA